MKKYGRTKPPMTAIALRVPRSLRELWYAAALKEELSQSEFFRKAVEERAIRVLTPSSSGRPAA